MKAAFIPFEHVGSNQVALRTIYINEDVKGPNDTPQIICYNFKNQITSHLRSHFLVQRTNIGRLVGLKI